MPPSMPSASGTNHNASKSAAEKRARNKRTQKRRARRAAEKKAAEKAAELQQSAKPGDDSAPEPDVMRITTDVIENVPKYMNALKEWTLDLRGKNIAVIENMGLAAKHNYDCIDLMDNDIQSLTGFPVLEKLDHLMIGNNRVSFIDPNIAKAMPRLMDFTAQNNRIADLGDLVPLGGLRLLEHLTLIDNPVTSKENYKYFVLWLCPGVRFLDYQKIKQAEREKANELYGTKEAPTALAESLMAQKSNEFDIPLSLGDAESQRGVSVKVNRMNLSADEQKRLQQLITNAKSIEEVEKLEKELNEGRVPAGVLSKR